MKRDLNNNINNNLNKEVNSDIKLININNEPILIPKIKFQNRIKFDKYYDNINNLSKTN